MRDPAPRLGVKYTHPCKTRKTHFFTINVNLQYVIVPAKQRGFAVMRKKVRVDVDSDEKTADLEVR